MIKLVAVDMDGTLLNRTGKVSDRNAEALRRLQQRGIETVICTGRKYEDAVVPLKAQGLEMDVICMNGAAVYDRSGTLLLEQPLEEQQVKEILRCCEGEEIIFDFMTDRGSCTTASEAAFQRCFESDILLPASVKHEYGEIRAQFCFITKEELFSQGLKFFKISVIHENPFVLEKVKRELKANEDLALASSYHTNIEVTGLNAQKGTALAGYALEKGIRLREIMAIGDSENDYSMLSLDLGYTVAMGNAMESIKKVARCQTRSNNDDGVAYAVETLVLSEEACAC